MRDRLLFVACALATSAVVGAWNAPARADGGTTSALSWVRLPKTESCISAAELGTRVEAHLHRAVFVSPSTADVSIEGHVEKASGDRFRAVVGGTKRDGTTIGSRELVSEGADCRTLDDSLVLVVALMIDPDADAKAHGDAQQAAPPPPPQREIVHERVVVHEVREVHDAPPAKPPHEPWLFDAYAAGTLALGRLPGAAPGIALAARVGPPHFVPFELRLGTMPSASADVGAGRTISFWELEASLGVCPTAPLGRFVEVGGCVEARLGSVRAQGTGFPQSLDAERLVFDAGLGGRALLYVARPLFVVAGVTALLPVVRQRYTATRADGTLEVLEERPAFGAEAALGLGVHFSP